MKKFLSIAGASICFVLSFALIRGSITRIADIDLGTKHGWRSGRSSVRLLVFGDVNLGRTVGQKILEDELDYPFQKIFIQRNSGDIVFANLESQLSEQDGETQDPEHNMIFTGPPNGASALASFGFTLVSTANNHAFDYGKDALFETLDHLDDQGIAHAGTARSSKYLYEPLVFEREGIRFAMFAVTDLMNFKNGWHDFVAVADTGRLFPAIREAVSSVDVVLVSFHGGDEYSDEPTSRVRDFADECVRQGVKVFLGHHPHVPYGVIKKDGSYIFHSLGNFVFYQPQLFWTQISFGAELRFEKNDTSTVVAAVEYIPLRVGYQPSILTDSSIVRQLQRRLETLSNIPITLTTNGYLN